jgi:hypothetical protein
MTTVKWHAVSCLWFCYAILARSSSTGNRNGIARHSGWSRETFPDPTMDPTSCRTDSKIFCDPDELISSKDELQFLESILMTNRTYSLSCAPSDRTAQQKRTTISVFVALMRRVCHSCIESHKRFRKSRKVVLTEIVCRLQMHQSRAVASDHPIGEEAETFARHLYESWYSQSTLNNECPNAGVLIFLSEQDHLIYVARGSALAHIITDERIERLTRQLRPLLNQKRYVRAISDMLEGLNFFILYGEPHGYCVRGWFLFGMGACLAVQVALCSFIRMTYNQRLPLGRSSRERWSEMERDRAETLKRRFQADSCPICLGSFRRRRDDASDNSSFVGSEGQPLILLRCGHVFDATCWMAWETTCFRSDSVVKCLLCRRTVHERASVEYVENPSGSV